MITLTPGQALVMVVVFFGIAVVIVWGLIAGELERRDERDRREHDRALRRELDRQGPPRWHR